MSKSDIKQSRLSESEALALLRVFDQYFHPCLSSRVNIEDFSKKLSKNADWILYEEDERTAGYIAFYSNIDAGIYYMTSYCEMPSNHKILEMMVSYLISNAPSSIYEIRFRCRKDNIYDLEFYKRNGFEVDEDLGDNYILRKHLLDN